VRPETRTRAASAGRRSADDIVISAVTIDVADAATAAMVYEAVGWQGVQ